MLEAAAHSFLVDLPDQALFVDTDPGRVIQIVENLLTNAAKYTPAGGTIRLALSRDDLDATITVRDTGIGIAGEDLPSIFGIFTQLPSGQSRSQGGLGIGLSLVRALTERHGGKVVAGGHRVLIVDDNEDAALSLATLLEIDGHDARTASSGAMALGLVSALSLDVVVIDIGLPDMSGYDLASLVRQTTGGDSLQLIALTGRSQPQDRQAAVEAGFQDFMTKPLDYESLLDMLR